jgi:hypothetical protein
MRPINCHGPPALSFLLSGTSCINEIPNKRGVGKEKVKYKSCVIYHRFRKERTEILLPGMLLQEIVNLVLQTYRSQHEPYAQCPTYCGQDLESKNHIAERILG